MNRDQIVLLMTAADIHLSKREIEFLECLSYYPDRWKSRPYFISYIYGNKPGDDPIEKIVDIYIMRLRRKLDEIASIETYHGQGAYRLVWNYDLIQVLKNNFSPHQLI